MGTQDLRSLSKAVGSNARYVYDGYYVMSIGAGEFGEDESLGAAADPIYSVSNTMGTWSLPNTATAATNIIATTRSLPRYWINGTIKVYVYFMPLVAGGGNVKLAIDINAGGVDATTTSLLSTTRDIVASSTQYKIQSDSVDCTADVVEEYDLVGITIARSYDLESSSLAGGLGIIGVALEYQANNPQ